MEKGAHKFNDSKNAPKMSVYVGTPNKKQSLIEKKDSEVICISTRPFKQKKNLNILTEPGLRNPCTKIKKS